MSLTLLCERALMLADRDQSAAGKIATAQLAILEAFPPGRSQKRKDFDTIAGTLARYLDAETRAFAELAAVVKPAVILLQTIATSGADTINLRLRQFVEEQGEQAAALPARQFVANRGDLIGVAIRDALMMAYEETPMEAVEA